MPAASPFSSQTRPLCVFCGAEPGHDLIYTKAAESVGKALGEASIPIVYGGGRRGLMAGGHVHGILPRPLLAPPEEDKSKSKEGKVPQSVEGSGQDHLANDFDGRLSVEVVETMHQRKAKAVQLATGGFVVLPGGFGTLEQFMEIITWNQNGMVRRPVIVLNVNNFYSPMRTLLEQGAEAGFIKPANLAFATFVDLPNDGNADAARAGEWGAAALQALKNWSLPDDAGFGYKWEANKTAGPDSDSEKDSAAAKKEHEAHMELPPMPLTKEEAALPPLFSTARYTAKEKPAKITRDLIPLWQRHVTRLSAAHAHFNLRDGSVWGAWPGEGALWDAVKTAIEEKGGKGDWRVRIMIYPGAKVAAQLVPAAEGTEPFGSFEKPASKRKLYLDPKSITKPDDPSYRIHKTQDRTAYDEAAARGPKDDKNAEVVMHDGHRVLETATSNFAVRMPCARAHKIKEAAQSRTQQRQQNREEAEIGADGSARGEVHVVEPRLIPKDRDDDDSDAACEDWEWITPVWGWLLPGVVRAELLDSGDISEGVLTLEDWREAARRGWRVVGFNGFRGVYDAEIASA